jgi:integrase/recombinase XerD
MKLSLATQGFLTFLKAEGYSPATVDLYNYVLKSLGNFLNDKDTETIKPVDLTRYFAFLRDGYKPERKNGNISPLSGSTLQNHWKGIRTFYKWAEIDLELKLRPDIKLKLPSNNPRVILPFSEGEVRALLKAAEYSNVAPGNRKAYTMRKRTADRDLSIILTLLDTGLRIGELCRLCVGDVNLETSEVYIAPFGNSNRKTKSRVVYLGRASKRAIWRYLAGRGEADKEEPLFVTERGDRRITTNSVRLLLADLGDKAGIKDCHPHRFRHTFCIEFLRNDGDVFNLQALTGHSTLDMLKTYLKLAQGDAAKAHKRASPVDNWKL